jgi:hypothetical protein
MRQIYYTNTELIFERACALREFGDRGDITWREWYNWKADQTGMKAGELEQAVAEELNIKASVLKKAIKTAHKMEFGKTQKEQELLENILTTVGKTL